MEKDVLFFLLILLLLIIFGGFAIYYKIKEGTAPAQLKAISVITFFITFLNLIHLDNKHRFKEYKESIRTQSYSGWVDSAYLDPDSKYQPYVLINHGQAISIQNEIYKQMQPGDYLYKRAGDFRHYLVHNGDTSTFYQQHGDDDIQ